MFKFLPNFGDFKIVIKSLCILLVFLFLSVKVIKSINKDIEIYKNIDKKQSLVFNNVIEISIKNKNKTLKTVILPYSSVVRLVVISDYYKYDTKIISIDILGRSK